MNEVAGVERGVEAELAELRARLDAGVDEVIIAACRALVDRARSEATADVRASTLRLLAEALRADGASPADVVAVLAEAAGLEGVTPAVHAVAIYDYALSMGRADAPRSLELLKEAANLFEQGADAGRLAVTLLELGDREGALGERTAALEHFEKARLAARAIGDARLVARSDDRIAAAWWELGRLEIAEQHLRDALAVWEATDDADAVAWARYRLGWCLADDVKVPARGDEALRLLLSAREHAQANDLMAVVAACDEKAAWVLADRGDQQQAVNLLRAACAVFDAIDDAYSLQVARANLAEHLLDLEQDDEAEFLLRKVIAADVDNPHARTGAAARLARHLTRTGRAEEAIRMLDDMATAVDLDDRLEGPMFLLARAAAYNALGMVQPTREAAEKALEHLDQANLPRQHAEVLEFLGRCAAYDGDSQKSEALLGKAIALYLVADSDDDARRLAAEIQPPIPKRDNPVAQPKLSTGQYL